MQEFVTNAVYVLQSQWTAADSACFGPADVILNITRANFNSTVWYDESQGTLLIPEWCGAQFVLDCSDPGMCFFSQFVVDQIIPPFNSMQSSFIQSSWISQPSQGYLSNSNGQSYCSYTNPAIPITTFLKLTSTACYQDPYTLASFSCSLSNTLSSYSDNACSNLSSSATLSSSSTSPFTLYGGIASTASIYTFGGGGQEIQWTNYVGTFQFFPNAGLGIACLLIFILTYLILVVLLAHCIYQFFLKPKYIGMVYIFALLLFFCHCILQTIFAFYSTSNQTWWAMIDEIDGVCFAIFSFLTTFINLYNVCHIAIRETWKRVALAVSLVILFIFMAGPKFLNWYLNAPVIDQSPFSLSLAVYNGQTFVAWTILYLFFDPASLVYIIYYITTRSLEAQELTSMDILQIMFEDRLFSTYFLIDVMNFLLVCLIEYATYRTLWLRSDAGMLCSNVSIVFFKLVNTCISIQLTEYLPFVLVRIKEVKKRLRSSVRAHNSNVKAVPKSDSIGQGDSHENEKHHKNKNSNNGPGSYARGVTDQFAVAPLGVDMPTRVTEEVEVPSPALTQDMAQAPTIIDHSPPD